MSSTFDDIINAILYGPEAMREPGVGQGYPDTPSADTISNNAWVTNQGQGDAIARMLMGMDTADQEVPIPMSRPQLPPYTAPELTPEQLGNANADAQRTIQNWQYE